jgi:hypothetical protein
VLDVFAEKPVKLHILNMAVLLSAVMGCTHKNIRMVNARAVLAVLGAPVAVVAMLSYVRLILHIRVRRSPTLKIAMPIKAMAVMVATVATVVMVETAARNKSANRTKSSSKANASKSVRKAKPMMLIVRQRDSIRA